MLVVGAKEEFERGVQLWRGLAWVVLAGRWWLASSVSLRRGEFVRPHAKLFYRRSGLHEGQQVRVDRFGLRGRHAVRESFVGL
jgi:hypothetical protein